MSEIVGDYWWAVLLVVVLLLVGLLILVRACGIKSLEIFGHKDIDWPKLDADLTWDDASAPASLAKVYDYVLGACEKTITWYNGRRRPKRVWGLLLRMGALLLTALAGVVPLSDKLGLTWFNLDPVWSTVMLAAAGVFVSIDVLQGFTSGWVRYMLAQQKVERLRDELLIDWNALKLAKADPKDMLERARALLLAISKVIEDETREWAAEFQSALKQMDKARREAAELRRTGAVEVSVVNPTLVEEWVLEIDGGERGRTSGKTLAVTEVAVGIRKLTVFGKDANGSRFSGEGTVNVQGGATASRELELS